MLTKKRLPFLIGLIGGAELLIYLWAIWTSTLDMSNFFAIQPEYILDKCARNSGRISSFLILITLFMLGYYGLKRIYKDLNKKESFLILITLFSINHLIHLLFVLLRFRFHGQSINIDGPFHIGGTLHGILTFICIVLIPLLLWNFKNLNRILYFVIIVHLLNLSLFINKTFLSKINLPEHPAYHNQLGIVVITAACLYVLFRVYIENKLNSTTYD